MTNKHKDRKNVTVSSLLISIISFDTIAILVAIAIGVHSGRPLKHFGEHRFITWISVLKLLTASLLSYKILQIRRLARRQFFWRAPFVIWVILSLGFLFLAADEYFEIHESIDFWIHGIFSIKETGVTDRIDDILVALYGLVGMSFLYVYRGELRKYRQALPFLKCGFVLLFIMVALDIFTNRKDILSILVHHDLVDTLHIWFSVAEDSFKIFAESCFLVGFYIVLQIARRIHLQIQHKLNL